MREREFRTILIKPCKSPAFFFFLMLVAVTVAHTVEGNWKVRIKRDFGCWGASPYRAGPCLETVIGTQNCTRKKKEI